MKLLIVEDEEILLKVLREKFEKEGFDVGVAVDGDEAMPAAKSFKPGLILLDIVLPKKDGLAVLAELKADSALRDIPVIILSNLGEDEKLKTALSLGAADYLVKTQHPINEVVEKVKEYLIKPK
jgi:DNA-binding response OmpR family regulator